MQWMHVYVTIKVCGMFKVDYQYVVCMQVYVCVCACVGVDRECKEGLQLRFPRSYPVALHYLQ